MRDLVTISMLFVLACGDSRTDLPDAAATLPDPTLAERTVELPTDICEPCRCIGPTNPILGCLSQTGTTLCARHYPCGSNGAWCTVLVVRDCAPDGVDPNP